MEVGGHHLWPAKMGFGGTIAAVRLLLKTGSLILMSYGFRVGNGFRPRDDSTASIVCIVCANLVDHGVAIGSVREERFNMLRNVRACRAEVFGHTDNFLLERASPTVDCHMVAHCTGHRLLARR